jgi:hypothetical protein
LDFKRQAAKVWGVLTVSGDFLGPVLPEPFVEVVKGYGSESYPSGSVNEDVLLDSGILAVLTCPLQVLEYNASRSKEDFFSVCPPAPTIGPFRFVALLMVVSGFGLRASRTSRTSKVPSYFEKIC